MYTCGKNLRGLKDEGFFFFVLLYFTHKLRMTYPVTMMNISDFFFFLLYCPPPGVHSCNPAMAADDLGCLSHHVYFRGIGCSYSETLPSSLSEPVTSFANVFLWIIRKQESGRRDGLHDCKSLDDTVLHHVRRPMR